MCCWVRDESLISSHFPENVTRKKTLNFLGKSAWRQEGVLYLTCQWHGLGVHVNNRPKVLRVFFIPLNGVCEEPNLTSITASCTNLSPKFAFFFAFRPRFYGNASVETRGSRLCHVLNFCGAWQLDAKFTVWNIMQWNVANRASGAFSFLFSPYLSGTELSTQLSSTSFFFSIGSEMHGSPGRCRGNQTDAPCGNRNTSSTRKHWAARRVFQRWFF